MTVEYLGNKLLLEQPMVAFLAPSKIAPESVLPSLDWAGEKAMKGQVVVSGFSSKLETTVWDVIARGSSPIVKVMVTRKYKVVPRQYRQLLDSGRLLLVFLNIDSRLSRKNAPCRNKYVATLAKEVVFSSINEDSSLFTLYLQLKDEGKPIIVLG